MKPKAQGTRAETRIIRLHQAWRLDAKRLAEGGKNDEGDVEVIGYLANTIEADLGPNLRVVGEVKDREKLNAPEALQKAMLKSGTYRTALFWSQPIKGGLIRRRKRVVVISESFWLELIGGHQPGIMGP
jgi:hypothetical protein